MVTKVLYYLSVVQLYGDYLFLIYYYINNISLGLNETGQRTIIARTNYPSFPEPVMYRSVKPPNETF